MAPVKASVLFCAVIVLFLQTVAADTPANCTYEDIVGKWTFGIGKGGFDNSLKCDDVGPVQAKISVKLAFPDVAVDQYGQKGYWTLIYNQGFEVAIHGRKYFAFSKYVGKAPNATSYCDQTMPGWSHDVLGHDWACFTGQKETPVKAKTYQYRLKSMRHGKYHPNYNFIEKINHVQKTWKAVHYPEYEHMTLETLMRRAGGLKAQLFSNPKPAKVKEETRKLADALPPTFDWRNVNGVNFVSPVRNQGGCGSCYAFASMAMNEARLRIASNNSKTTVFSPQDIVECSKYSQGCDGGFPYLIGGKYATDFGLVEEKCNPYTGEDGPCRTDASCPRHYSVGYQYVGGFYGGCNEEEMRLSLVQGGPLVVAFEVYNDFFNYKGGIYQHTGLKDWLNFNPFQLTNHAVTLVGYGEENGMKFWVVKNSWGSTWGEDGYFRILRGVDECAIESIAVGATPIF